MSLRARRRPAANARQVVITEYGVDQFGAGTSVAFGDMAARGMQGLSGTAYVGDKGDPSRSFYGTTRATPQHFAGAAQLGAVRHTYKDTPPEIDNGYAVGPYADPARQIFADRLRQRRR